MKYGVVYWKGEEYREGHGVYLQPDAFSFKYPELKDKVKRDDQVKVWNIYHILLKSLLLEINTLIT